MIDIKNKNVILLISCLVLLFAGLRINDPFNWFNYGYKDAPALLDNFIPDNLQKITVYDESKLKLQFSRGNDGWKVSSAANENHRANNKLVSDSLKNLSEMKRFREITSNKEKFAEFQVSKENFHVELTDNANNKFDVYLGKSGESFSTTLVRLAEEEEVFSVKGSLKQDWNKSVDEFRDKKVFRLASANILSIELQGPESYSLKKSPNINTWIISSKKDSPAKKDSVSNILTQIEELEGSRYEISTPSLKPYGKIDIVLGANVQMTAEVFQNAKGTEYYIKSTYNPDLMVIAKFKLDAIFVKEETIIEKAAAPATPEGSTN